MSNISIALLTKLLTERDIDLFDKYGISDESLWSENVRDVVTFIKQHLTTYKEMPSIHSVVYANPSFEPLDSTESLPTLVSKLMDEDKRRRMKKAIEESIKGFRTQSPEIFAQRLSDKLSQIAERIDQKSDVFDWSTDTSRVNWFKDRSMNADNSKIIPILYDELSNKIGGGRPGSYIVLVAGFKRGKSWIAEQEALIASRKGFKVLLLSAEMDTDEVACRLDTLASGISNRALWFGTDDELIHAQYKEFIHNQSRIQSGSIIVRTPKDWPYGFTVDTIRHEAIRFSPDIMIIDQFPLIVPKTAGHEGQREISRDIRLLASRLGICVFMLTQAPGDYIKNSDDEDEGGVRKLVLPNSSQYARTIGVYQDCTALLAFDSVQWIDTTSGMEMGKALIGIELSRTGGAGFTLDLDWYPDSGVIGPRRLEDNF